MADPTTQAMRLQMLLAGDVSPEALEMLQKSRQLGGDMNAEGERLKRALADLEGSQAGIGQAIGTRTVPSPFGAIVTRRSPLEKLLAGLNMGVDAYRSKSSQNKLAEMRKLDAGYARQLAEENGKAQKAATERLIGLLMRQQPVPGVVEPGYDGEGY